LLNGKNSIKNFIFLYKKIDLIVLPPGNRDSILKENYPNPERSDSTFQDLLLEPTLICPTKDSTENEIVDKLELGKIIKMRSH